jgi:hypothetical protein
MEENPFKSDIPLTEPEISDWKLFIQPSEFIFYYETEKLI